MRKNLGSIAGIFPMPVLMIGTFNSDGSVDVMNAAWGMMADMKKVALNLTESHKTVKNIKERGYFTVSIADSLHVCEADYLGITSCNTEPQKFKKSGLTYHKSELVDAPIIDEFPITMECKFIEYQNNENGVGVIGEIINTSIDEKYLNNEEKVDIEKLHAICYDPFNHGYYEIGKKVGQAFSDGKKLK